MMNLESLPELSGWCEESWCPPCEHLHERGLLVGVTLFCFSVLGSGMGWRCVCIYHSI